MKNEIILVGLPFERNIGDIAIYESTKGMLSEELEKLGIQGMEIVQMDMTGRHERGEGIRRRPKEEDKDLPRWYLSRREKANKMPDEEKKRVKKRLFGEYEVWSECRRLFNSNTAAVIFTGGGIIKYYMQIFPEYLDVITSYAKKFHVPVMISAAGVEGFDSQDPQCRRLRKALNRFCVKMITTRDDLDTLRNQYCSHRIVTAQVADPACSMKRFYEPEDRKTEGQKTIGLNVVRGELFKDNGIELEEEEVILLWQEIFLEVVKRGYRCRLYVNGNFTDRRTLAKLEEKLAEQGYSDVTEQLPENCGCHEVIDVMAGFDGVIAARLHSTILSYAYDIPAVGLVWNEKQPLFGEAIGFPERFIRREDFKAPHIVDALEKAMNEGYGDPEKRKNYMDSTEKYLEQFLGKYLRRGK